MKKWKDYFIPFNNEELKLFIPMVLMMFCFLFNYTIMRDTKDTLILMNAGAEAIPFIKFWGTLPCSILFLIIYAKLSNSLEPKKLFTVTLVPFFAFFLLFGFVFYPYREALEPTSLVNYLHFHLNACPESMHHTLTVLINLVKNWMYVVFYILSELWGSMGVSLLFWQFANQITSTENAKRFYPRFTQFGNLSLIFSGLFIIYFSDIREHLSSGSDPWEITLKWLMGAIAICCAIILYCYFRINKGLETQNPVEKKKSKEKPKLSLKESFFFLIRSKYLGLICILVLAYGISISLIEVVYKSQLKRQFTTENELCSFIGMVSIFTGVATFAMVTLSSHILRFTGWLRAAVLTPVLMLATGAIFFLCISFDMSILGFTSLWIGVVFGACQNILSKSCKYSLFDPTKEMAYIPLDVDSKVKGKAAIDVVGARFGKSLGGVFLQIIFLFGSVMQSLSLIFSVVALVIFVWIFAVIRLNKLYEPLVEQKAEV